MQGIVTDAREAVLRVSVVGKGGTEAFDFIVDTGFTGFLSLTRDEIDALDLVPGPESLFTFANGHETPLVTYEAKVNWDGKLRRVKVVPLTAARLIGMNLLSGATVTFEACPNGALEIETDTVENFI